MDTSKNAHRGSRGDTWLKFPLHDLRFAARALRRDPIFSTATILILTLALALNVTTFRAMDATLFHGCPLVKENERLLFIDERFPTPACCVSYADFEGWERRRIRFKTWPSAPSTWPL